MVVVGLNRGPGLQEMESLRDGRTPIREPEEQVLETQEQDNPEKLTKSPPSHKTPAGTLALMLVGVLSLFCKVSSPGSQTVFSRGEGRDMCHASFQSFWHFPFEIFGALGFLRSLTTPECHRRSGRNR